MQSYTPPSRKTRACKYWWFDGWDWIVNRAIRLAGPTKISIGDGEVAIDPHIHTLFSHCSISRAEAIIRGAVKIGLGGVGITDHHGDVRGALDAVCCAEYLKQKGEIPQDFLVIPGTEISSISGHIAALFVREKLPEHLTPEQTVRVIHEAGGLAVAAHPYHSTGIGDAVFDAPFDAVEVECGSVFDAGLVKRIRALGSDPRLADVAKLGSSDAHYIQAIGSCYSVLTIDEPTLEAAKRAITQARSTARSSIPYCRLRMLLGGVSKLK